MMQIREAVIEESQQITDEIINFSLSEGIKADDIVYEKSLSYIKKSFFKKNNFSKIVVDNEGNIVGGLFLDIGELVYNHNVVLDNQMFFTSPQYNNYVRMKATIFLLKSGIEWAIKKKVKSLRMNIHFARPSIMKFIKKLGFKIEKICYSLELN